MKKIGIITINDYNNYGNRLQNYAAQETLKKFDCEVETILYNPVREKENNLSSRLSKVMDMRSHEIIESIKYVINSKIKMLKYGETIKERNILMERFSKKYIHETNYDIAIDRIPNDLGNRYNYFVVGSDQVWNPKFRYGSPVDFLTFAPTHKRIAFAPSFGVSDIPTEYIEDYRKWISEMGSLSVREQAGAKIIQALTGYEVPVLLDPTAMLTQDEWKKFIKPIENKPEKKYILTYFLGSLSKKRKRLMNKIATMHDLDIINLGSLKDRERFLATPDEFLSYIESATLFLTDSFHGALFSILFKKDFVVFNRDENLPSMNSRIETLLEKFNLAERTSMNVNFDKDLFGIDFQGVDEIFYNERIITESYLRNALDKCYDNENL